MVSTAHRKEYFDKYYSANKERINRNNNERRNTVVGKRIVADSTLRYKYGISLDDKQKMYEEQKGLCKLCHKPLPTDFQKAHTDHNHQTGEVRGLLHGKCNRFLGQLEKSLDLVQSAVEYIRGVVK